MEDSIQRASPSFSGTERLAIAFLTLLLICMSLWPACRLTSLAGFSGLTRPFLSPNSASSKPIPINLDGGTKSSADRTARLARSMEFRIRQYPVHPDALKAWSAEWKLQPAESLFLLRPLLVQLPEASAREASALQRNDLSQSILQVAADVRTAHPNNSAPSLAESLALFYAGQDALSLNALRQSQAAGRSSLGLFDLNKSENIIWRLDAPRSILFPRTPRTWNLDLEKTFHLFSRGLALQERALLQKYNIEKAVDITFLHLGLARQISDMGWGPSDFATAHGMARRAMLPFWNTKDVEPSLRQLGDHFARFLEDQGDKIGPAKVRAILGDFESQQSALEKNLPTWRKIQLVGTWNAAGVLSCLFLQTISLLLVWGTVAFSFDNSPASPEAGRKPLLQWGLSGIPFALPPLAWTLFGWSHGGFYLLAGWLGSWLLWAALLKYHLNDFRLQEIRTSLSQGLVTMAIVTLLTTLSAAAVFQFRMDHLRSFLDHGWLG